MALFGILFIIVLISTFAKPLASSERSPFSGVVIDMSEPNICMYSSLEFEDMDLLSHAHVFDAGGFGSFKNVAQSKVERNDYSQDQTLYIMKRESDMEIPTRGELMKNKQNVFYFKDTQSSVYYDHEDKDWFEYSLKKEEPATVHAFPDLIPISPCIDSSEGDGGYVSQKYEVGLTITGTLGPQLSYNISPITIGANIGLAVAPSFSFSGSYECDVAKGQYGQMFIEPFYVDLPSGGRRKVAYRKFRGIVANGESYESFSRFKMIAKHKPNHYCLVDTDPGNLQCGDKIGGG